MKKRSRIVKTTRIVVVYSIIFALLCPYSLFAQGNVEYKKSETTLLETVSHFTPSDVVPHTTEEKNEALLIKANSIYNSSTETAHLLPIESQTDSLTVVAAPAVVSKPEVRNFEISEPKERQGTTQSLTVVTKLPPAHQELSSPHKKTKNVKRSKTVNYRQPKASMILSTANKLVIQSKLLTKNELPLFSTALSKMQQNKDYRQNEAARLGIVLPSQNGNIADISPSLSKIQITLKSIMARQA